ncbi:MAG: alpha/beta hydrolase [Acidimicrobiales bacterium]
MKYAESDVGPGSLAYAEAGAGGVPLLLLHGFTGAKEDFTDWLDALSDCGWHAVAPDLRGHGDSHQPEGESEYSLATFAADALALADDLGWDRFVLVGHSMGGMIAQHLALAEPDRLMGLVLMDTGHGAVEGVDPDLVALGIEVARTQGLDVIADLSADRESPLATEADRRVRAERPGYAEFGDRKFRACSAAMYAAMAIELFEQPDRLAALSALAVPTLVIVGEQDEPFIGPSQRMASAIPGARLATVADAGHSPQFEAPDAWWEALDAFLSELRAA